MVLLFVTVVVFNGTGWFLYVQVRRTMEQRMGEQLVLYGQWSATELRLRLSEIFASIDDVPFLEDEPPAALERLRTEMTALVPKLGLTRLIVYDADLRVKLDTAGLVDVNKQNPYAVVDQYEIAQALAGTPAATLSYNVADNPFMRAYVPLLGEDGALDGLLAVEGQRTYFQPLMRLRNLMLVLGALVSGALLVMAALALQALRRFVRLEEAMNHTDRLQTLGTLAAGMAHEIRNPLGIIRITAETLERELERAGAASADRVAMCRDILGEVDRVHGLVGRFLDYARPGEASAQPGEIVPAIHHTVRLSQKALTRGRVVIETEIDPALDGARTPLPAPSLQQVLFNLLRNAQEAMDEAGRSGTVQVTAAPGPRDGEVSIAVRDGGVGMTPAQVRRAGEPFVTTKPGGTGLGLSITKNLLASVQGRLEIASRREEGTTVRVTLPLVRAQEIPRMTPIPGEGEVCDGH